MVRDIELPFTYHTRMNRCQLNFLLYLLTKQDGDFKPKWWPDNIRFEQPISNLLGIPKDSFIDVFKSYYKLKGDSDWLRAVLYFIINLDNLTNETDFETIDISGKISYKGVEFDIVPSMKIVNPNVKVQPVSYVVNNKKKFTIMNQSTVGKLNISPAVVAHFNGTELKDKAFGGNVDVIDLTNIKEIKIDQDVKLCIKESHIKKMMPTASVQLYDVVKYNNLHSKEDFLLTLNLMKTDVLSKLNLLKFRKRLRNNSRDSFRSVSEFEKDLVKFKSKPNREALKVQSKQKEKNKNLLMKVKEKDKVESSNTSTEYMVVNDSPLPLNETIDVDGDTDMNKENEIVENSLKENITTAVNSICSPKPSNPLQSKNNKYRESTDSVVIDLTLEDTPTKIQKGTNNLYQFLNMSPMISPKLEYKITPKTSPKKQSSPKRLNRFSMPLINQKDIKSYFNPIPMKLTPQFIAKKLDELKKVCRPCFVRLDLVKDLKPIRSIRKIETLPLPLVIEEVAVPIVDLTNDEDLIQSFVNKNETITVPESGNIEENVVEASKVETKDKVNNKPKNDLKIKSNIVKKKKVIIKVKWPSKRITL